MCYKQTQYYFHTQIKIQRAALIFCSVMVLLRCVLVKMNTIIVQQPFYCERCEYVLQNQRTTDCTKVKCMYCPNIDGAMKMVGKD